ncbi:MAG: hypothetical protein EKK41_12760 [Hyphomicrobiales bacterium]|nr:MAG: hypothetical protein EKK41_12760 [Hyphomicrobiales bacterium]
MPSVPTLAIASAALIFITLSAAMNALFLSSLGRTPVETVMLGVLSLAADTAKAVLPVVFARSIRLRAFGQTIGAALMLVIVMALSLASGTGFAAMTRGAATSAHEAERLSRAAKEQELRAIDARLALMPVGLPVAVIEAEIARASADRRWGLSKSCTDLASAALRQFCAGHLSLTVSLAAASARERISAERAALIIALTSKATTLIDADPQATAVAALTGLDASKIRRLLSVAFAATLELGSVILVLLLTGPAVLKWRDPDAPAELWPARLPQSTDVTRWRRQQGKFGFGMRREASNDNG